MNQPMSAKSHFVRSTSDESEVLIAGDYDVGLASFGPSLTTSGVTGNVVLVNDGVGTPTNACEPLVNGAAVSGNIALLDRGGCTFVVKVKNAQNAGQQTVRATGCAKPSPDASSTFTPSIDVANVALVSLIAAPSDAVTAAITTSGAAPKPMSPMPTAASSNPGASVVVSVAGGTPDVVVAAAESIGTIAIAGVVPPGAASLEHDAVAPTTRTSAIVEIERPRIAAA